MISLDVETVHGKAEEGEGVQITDMGGIDNCSRGISKGANSNCFGIRIDHPATLDRLKQWSTT